VFLAPRCFGIHFGAPHKQKIRKKKKKRKYKKIEKQMLEENKKNISIRRIY
jgi:hypothetical protein